MLSLYSPRGTHDRNFLANYAYINLVDEILRLPGVGDTLVYGGRYAMRIWVRPDQLAKLQVTVPEIARAIQQQNTVNPAGQVGGEPAPPGQEFTYTMRAQGRLITPEEFGNIVIRANRDGSVLRVSDVARVELGRRDLQRPGPRERLPGGGHADLPVAGIERPRCGHGGADAHGRTETAFPRRCGFPRFPRHDAARDGGHHRDPDHAAGGAGAGGAGGLSCSCRTGGPR